MRGGPEVKHGSCTIVLFPGNHGAHGMSGFIAGLNLQQPIEIRERSGAGVLKLQLSRCFQRGDVTGRDMEGFIEGANRGGCVSRFRKGEPAQRE